MFLFNKKIEKKNKYYKSASQRKGIKKEMSFTIDEERRPQQAAGAQEARPPEVSKAAESRSSWQVLT